MTLDRDKNKMMVEKHNVEMPLTEFVKGVAREAAMVVIHEHTLSCPVAKDVAELEILHKELDREVGKVKLKYATLVGMMLGAGGIGGLTSGSLVSFLLRG